MNHRSVSPSREATSICSTTCPYCGVGCGIDAHVNRSTYQLISVEGSPEHPANHGRLCSKGQHLADSVGSQNRLLAPMIHQQTASWEAATQKVAAIFHDVLQREGPEAIALYGSGQLLTEDYYVANKWMKGYLGSANIDSNSRLCMSSAVSAYKRAFGADLVPTCYEDIEQTDYIVLVGSNAAWTHPVLFRRIERAKQLNPAVQLIVIDPRETASCGIADLHLPLAPDSDTALFQGLLAYLSTHEGLDQPYIQAYTEGFSEALEKARPWSVESVAAYCGLPASDVLRFYRGFLTSQRVLTMYCMGVNQSASGTDNANAIINCHLASGQLGRPGCGPFSLTGQPNAMGGREVGAMANLLAAHLEIENTQHQQLLQQFWQSPTMVRQAGLKALDIFKQAAAGKIKVLWIMATNPMVSVSDRQLVEKALRRCEHVIVSDCVADNDTLAFADIKLPATGWSEKEGTVTNSERCISRQRRLFPPMGEARHDWQIISDVATAMGYEGFAFEHPHEIFNEHVALSGYRNDGSRFFDLSGLGELSAQAYQQLQPIQWPVTPQNPQGSGRLLTDHRYATPSGRARFIPLDVKAAVQQPDAAYSFVLNSGRLRDQWHTMTRTGQAASLMRHHFQPFVGIHPEDAHARGISDNQWVELRAAITDTETVVLPALLDRSVMRGQLFVPIHWNKQFASHSNISALYHAVADPISGQPESKSGAVSITPRPIGTHAIFACREPLDNTYLSDVADFWIKTPLSNGYVYQLAQHDCDSTALKALMETVSTPALRLVRESTSNTVAIVGNEHQVVAYFNSRDTRLSREAMVDWMAWLEQLFAQTWTEKVFEQQAMPWLSGEIDPQFQQGAVVCSCLQVHEQAIDQAIQAGCNSVNQLTEQLGCGSQCGSCKPELVHLLQQREEVVYSERHAR